MTAMRQGKVGAKLAFVQQDSPSRVIRKHLTASAGFAARTP
jgi:hypothetical protein